ncbi:PadR family transcriptional regulator [Streptomyces anulatus]|uniref:PadR family transcriptional regulator n=1 Tax=Streptomyces anulatus TaxID=1892 RepID=UPI00225858F5|nr:PadR family transcriptional regulator [Streptomyces anulatus]MCX4506715.1 PadR family transcriptional regulator [Streptomyces anulatus]MCX4523637.1 PadR family transcriptional regulator [Streptomyces anulatus]MCX4523766.1 PadR family transcriptional regulator [Streptomyces anulatus]MCX4606724.1 PadR family transcriptional regulator [Streptomyces anulatus]MCX4606955.1 PadR family transcriptional regulator [Streptomyces anulatus]
MTKGLPAARDQRRSQLLRGVLDLCLLSLIAERPRYGFEFTEALAAGGLELVSDGSIYPLLARMERAGLISSFRASSPSGGAPRKYYRLTEAGHAELSGGRADWFTFAGQVGRILTATEPTGGTTP